MALALAALGGLHALTSSAAPVALTVPYSPTPVSDADLDGDPATGSWGDALSVTIPLENGEPDPYGTATLYAKHDGVNAYFRIDGAIDVTWVSAAGDHFWLGFHISPDGTSHHGAGTWDGVYFGLWDGTDYAPQPTYPPTPVDASGFERPPAKDASQDLLGAMQSFGASAPYGFTAEWKRPLDSGDADDLVYVADGTTTYNFFVTTDSNGGGSAGGSVSHRKVTNLNTMKIAPAGSPNTPPTSDLTAPDGGEDWTAGTSHTIWWNMSDAEDPTSALKVWLNYSLDDGATYSPITGAQGISGLANPCTFAWVTPDVDSATARVKLEVVDSAGALAGDVSAAVFTLDATAPSVIGTIPGDGATDVPPTTTIEVTFSESMKEPATEQAFSLSRDDTGDYLPGTSSWLGSTLTFTPAAALAEGIPFTGRVNTTALDGSDPGNALPSVYVFGFTTADATPPTIQNVVATPSLQESGGSVNITASVTDNGVVAGVWIEVTDPGGALLGNFSMSWDAGSGLYFFLATYRTTGTYDFRIVARDAAGNWNAALGSFAVQDTTDPTIVHIPPAGATVGVGIPLDALVADNDAVAEARVNYTDVLGVTTNATMVLSGSLYTYTIPGQPQTGTVDYFVWAVDPSGNEARTSVYTIPVAVSDTTAPTIASVTVDPPVQDVPLPVNISASVTDNVAVASVVLNVSNPFGASLGNVSMVRLGVTDTYFLEGVYADLGTYDFVIWANDTSDNFASATGRFTVSDLSRPVIETFAAGPSPQEAGQPVDFSARVTDNDQVATVTVVIRDPGDTPMGNFTMTASVDGYAYSARFDTLGVHSYTIWAADASGNHASATGQFTIQDTIPPTVVATGAGTYWIGTTVDLDASNSTDNSAIENVNWTFLYNGSPVERFGFRMSFTFDLAGQYDVSVTVTDRAGLWATEVLTVLVITDTAPPRTPVIESVEATEPGCLAVTLEASQDPDLGGYRVYRWNSSRNGFELAAELSANETSFEDCGLEYDRVYTYWVLAFDDLNNESPPSRMANGRTTAPPVSASSLLPYQMAVAGLVVLTAVLAPVALRRRRPPNSGEPGTQREDDRPPD